MRCSSVNSADALLGERHERIELAARERAAFAGSLNLDHAAGPQPNDVQIDFGLRIFTVVEIEQDLARHDACAHGRDASRRTLRRQFGAQPGQWRRRRR